MLSVGILRSLVRAHSFHSLARALQVRSTGKSSRHAVRTPEFDVSDVHLGDGLLTLSSWVATSVATGGRAGKDTCFLGEAACLWRIS